MKRKRGIVSQIYMILVYAFLFLPVLAVIRGSFTEGKSTTRLSGFTTQWYVTMVENADLLESLQNTLMLAVLSTLCSVVLGSLIAFGMYRFRFRGRTLLDGMLYIPIIIPEIVLGIALMTIFSLLRIDSGMLTLVLAHTTFCLPYVAFNVNASIAGFDPALEEAAMDLGCNRLQTFFRITLPLILPGVKSGAFMALTLSIDDVIISYYTSGPGCITLPIKVMNLTKRGITPDVNALATIMILVVLAVMILAKLPWRKIFKRT